MYETSMRTIVISARSVVVHALDRSQSPAGPQEPGGFADAVPPLPSTMAGILKRNSYRLRPLLPSADGISA